MTIEDDLRSALHHHADRVEPSADGLSKIERRLAAPPAQRPRLMNRLLVAAVLLVAVGAIGALAFRSDQNDGVNVAISSSTTDPAAAAVANDLPPLDLDDDTAPGASSASVVESTPAVTYEDIPPAPAGVLGPRAADPESAVEAFLGLIQRGGEDVTIEVQGPLALVSRVGEGGDMVDVTVVQLGSVGLGDEAPGFVVVQANAPNIVIESPSLLATTSGPVVTVTGQGEGFEAQVDVDLYSSDDGVWLNRGFVQAGNFGVLAPFSTDLAVSGSGPAWVVVQSGGATETNLDPFSAVPVVVDAPRVEPEYLVTNIPADDPDGGLIVRSLPGTDGAPVGVLPPGQGSITKRAALSAYIGDGEPSYGLEPVTVGEQEWWNVWVPEPLDNGRNWGWVNARYLSTASQLAAAELETIGWTFVDVLRGDDAALAMLPWSPDGVIFGLSSDVRETTADKAANPGFWQEQFAFTPPPDFVGTLDGTLRSILSPTGAELTPDTAVDVGMVPILEMSPYSTVDEALAARFPGASVVQLTDPTNDGSGWRLINVFIQQGADGPEIAGIVGIGWTP